MIKKKLEELELQKSLLEKRLEEIEREMQGISDFSSFAAIVFCIFPPGLHRILNGKVLSGLLYMFTGGGFFIWTIFDMIYIATGRFQDGSGRYINSAKKVGLEIERKSTFDEIRKLYESIENLKKHHNI